jgi:uncharacterized protein involved in exopolysaccharide biosynthesis/Mrp family chromosome partitioning ATPase
MPQPNRDPTEFTLNLDEILFILFRHKWKILFCAAIGVALAVNTYLRYQPSYESEAKLMLRYVVDRSAVDSIDSQPKTPGASYGDSLINAEIEILTSWDLAEQVAGAIGIDRFPGPNGEVSKATAAQNILRGVTASAPKGGSIIYVSYKDGDPQLAVRVLQELVSLYFVRHLELHRSADAFNFVAQQSDQVRARLNQTEEDLKQLKTKAGISSLADSTITINAELARSKEALRSAETDLAGQRAATEAMEKQVAERKKEMENVQPETNEAVIKQYQALLTRLSQLRQDELDQLSKFPPKLASAPSPTPTPHQSAYAQTSYLTQRPRVGGSGFVGIDRENALNLARERYRRQNDSGFAYQGGKKDFDSLVKEAEKDVLARKIVDSQNQNASSEQLLRAGQLQTDNIEKQLSDLEKRYPGLLATTAAMPGHAAEMGLSVDRANLAGIQARIGALKARVQDLEIQAGRLASIAPQIAQLERKREIEDANYKYFQASLERARVDEALDPAKMPNISAVQTPSPPMRVTAGLKKKMASLVGGGLAVGIALAFLLELVVDRSVKRPLELTTRLRIPMLLWIPYIAYRKRLALTFPRLALRGSPRQLSGRNHIAPWDQEHFIRPFSEALRDRLTLYFQVRNMTHKPKLVALTGCSKGAGTSTLAAGLAAALSETGDGKVLLVDMNVGRAEMHPFFRGTPSCTLSEALVGEPTPAGENLYLAVASPPGVRQAQIVPKKFNDLVPHLKASYFDYIIFDMPALNQTSITLATAGYMDKVVLVAEAEKSNRQVVKRAYLELASVNANVSAVLNKLRFYAPKFLAVEG